jgi:hypothetical protein
MSFFNKIYVISGGFFPLKFELFSAVFEPGATKIYLLPKVTDTYFDDFQAWCRQNFAAAESNWGLLQRFSGLVPLKFRCFRK